jgi:hypothetical protein
VKGTSPMKELLLRLQCATHKFSSDLERIPQVFQKGIDIQRIHEITVEIEQAHRKFVLFMTKEENTNA